MTTSYIRVRNKTYRVVDGVRYREIDGYIRSEVVEELKSLRNTMQSVMTGGQSYTIGSRSLTRIDPNALQNREKYLLNLLSQFDNDCGDVRTQFAVPTEY